MGLCQYFAVGHPASQFRWQ